MQHCAFVVTAERFREVEARLKWHGIDYIGPIAQLPGLRRRADRNGYSAIAVAAGWSEAIACPMTQHVFTVSSPSGRSTKQPPPILRIR
jgi:hypothetical protein